MESQEKPLLNLKKLRTKKESVYFWISVVVSILFWGWIFYPSSGINEEYYFGLLGLVGILFGIQLLLILLSLLSMAYIRMNGLKIGKEQFPQLYEASQVVSKQLGLKKMPDIFIINNGGLLNAFATKLNFRRVIVLYSDLVDALDSEKDNKQVMAVLAHELGHHALGHTEFWINYFISPSSLLITLGAAFSRAREYSADQVMKAVVQDEETQARSLIKLATGGRIGQKANIDAYLHQIKEEKGFLAWTAEIFSSHPFLPKRIRALRESDSSEKFS